jgi:hypothetical protein
MIPERFYKSKMSWVLPVPSVLAGVGLEIAGLSSVSGKTHTL